MTTAYASGRYFMQISEPANTPDRVFRVMVLEKFNMSLGSGLSKLASKVFCIDQLSNVNDFILLGTLSGVEIGVSFASVSHQKGGVTAAMGILNE